MLTNYRAGIHLLRNYSLILSMALKSCVHTGTCILLLALLIGACTKDPAQEAAFAYSTANAEAYGWYSPGTWWKYEDQLSGAVDSVFITENTTTWDPFDPPMEQESYFEHQTALASPAEYNVEVIENLIWIFDRSIRVNNIPVDLDSLQVGSETFYDVMDSEPSDTVRYLYIAKNIGLIQRLELDSIGDTASFWQLIDYQIVQDFPVD